MEDIVGIRKNSPKKIDKTGKRTVLFSANRNIQTIKERTFLSGESIVRYNKSASLRRKAGNVICGKVKSKIKDGKI
ncbi:MAG: hypothetical protein ACLRPV_08355 [Lacrimispora saccharolytica]|nr:hypothetical protein [Lachnospiraceae bacterium]